MKLVIKSLLALGIALAGNASLAHTDKPHAKKAGAVKKEQKDWGTDLIRKVAAQRTVLMVEHNLSVVEKLSDVITVLQRGQILAEGPYAVVSQDPRVLEAYVGVEA